MLKTVSMTGVAGEEVPSMTLWGIFVIGIIVSQMFLMGPSVGYAQRIELISVSTDNDGADGDSTTPAISADGHRVAFASAATDLIKEDLGTPSDIEGDNNLLDDIFFRWINGEDVRRLSRANQEGSFGGDQNPDGESATPSFSDNGQYAAFASLAKNLGLEGRRGHADYWDVFVSTRGLGGQRLVSVAADRGEANGSSTFPSISGDGQSVAFQSDATNLVNNDLNTTSDIFVRDLDNDTTTRVSVADNETEADGASTHSSISANGRYIAFQSDASNLVDDDDTNGASDIFVRDLNNDTTTRVSVADDETQADGASTHPSISADGRYIAFQSDAPNLVDDDTNGVSDIFVRDRWTKITLRASIDPSLGEGNGDSTEPAISGNGRLVAFTSTATNLVGNDHNDTTADIFVANLREELESVEQITDLTASTVGGSNKVSLTGTLPNPSGLFSATDFVVQWINIEAEIGTGVKQININITGIDDASWNLAADGVTFTITVDDPRVQMNESHWFKVRVAYAKSPIDPLGPQSPWSNRAYGVPGQPSPASPPTVPPARVTGLTATPRASNLVDLTWVLLTEEGEGVPVTDYLIRYREETRSRWSALRSAGIIDNQYQVSGLTSGTLYRFQIRAVNELGRGPWSHRAYAEPGQITQATAPARVTGVSGTPGDRQVTLTWNGLDSVEDQGSTTFDGYQIRYRTDSGGWMDWDHNQGMPGIQPIIPHSDDSDPSQISTQTETVTGLMNQTAYTFQVWAVNGAGRGTRSGRVTATPISPSP